MNPIPPIRQTTRRLMPLHLLLGLGLASSAAADTLDVLGTFIWKQDGAIGLSGLEVASDGTSFSTISDRGWYITGRFERQDGVLTDVTLHSLQPILGNDGLPVAARRVGDWSDAEGLAIGENGAVWISYERWARVARHPTLTTASTWIADHPTFASYRDNRQLEALAIHPNGDLYTFAEEPLDGTFAIYRLSPNGWTIDGAIAPSDGFAIVGADFHTDGALFLLERKLVLGLWWQSRVRRISNITAPVEIETLWTSARGAFGNLEGIAVWQATDGIRLTMVSDNNADADEQTTFVEARVGPSED
ncbi:esterase-like activity of phytase family protein [Yoonia sp. R2331]|uniref:esterase-like activity of phytase family protein n=1 Tax=Yoonia sp. R2331 TaxID=3237238 RepID=UPI0034E500F1